MKPFLQLVTVAEAYRQLSGFGPTAKERAKTLLAMGRVLASQLHAPEDVPHFERSNMDGYAVRAEDTWKAEEHASALLSIQGEVAMGREANEPLAPGFAMRVSTGAMLPPGADAVVMVEHTEQSRDGLVAIHASVVAGQNIVRVGEDMQKGELLYRSGRRIRGSDVGVLASLGISSVEVYRRPRVAVIATGDEIVEMDAPLLPGKVRNFNEHALVGLARHCGAVVDEHSIVQDETESLTRSLSRAVASSDAVLISGGSSKGHRDVTRAAIEALEGAEVIFHGVAMAPGKPTILARAGRCVILGLPGNPAAAFVVFYLFAAPLLRTLEGEPFEKILATRPLLRARLTEAARPAAGRETYIRVRIEPAEDLPLAHPLLGKSVAVSTVARADGLLRIPLSTEGFAAGETVEVLLL